jgi:single-strand DNA-binding protein
MKSVNKVILIGNLTRDPEIVQIGESSEVAKFSLAINDSYKKQTGELVENTIYMDCEAWSGLAKVASNYLRKGSKIYVEGRLKSDNWTDAESGKPRTKLKIQVLDLVMLDGKKDGQSSGGYSDDNNSNRGNDSDNSPSVNAVDDELPF